MVPPRHPQPVLATVGDIEEAPATADHTIVAITIVVISMATVSVLSAAATPQIRKAPPTCPPVQCMLRAAYRSRQSTR